MARPLSDTESDGLEKPSLERRLQDGMDPNQLWTESDLAASKWRLGTRHSVRIDRPSSDAWAHYNTPLHRALRSSNIGSAEVLVKHGADVNLYNALGQTPLHEAVRTHNDAAVHFLLDHGVDVNKPSIAAQVHWIDQERDLSSHGGETCLQLALFNSDMATLRLLTTASANLCPDSQKPWNALDLAILSRNEAAVTFLRDQTGLGNQGLALSQSTNEVCSSPDTTSYLGPARALLDFASSVPFTTLPPANLYDVYCHTARLARERRGNQGQSSLITAFFAALEDVTGITGLRQQRTDKLCKSCRLFQAEARCLFNRQDLTPFRFTLHESREALEASARTGCQLCAITADALDRAEEQREDQSEDEASNGSSMSHTVFLGASLGASAMESVSTSCGKKCAEIDVAFSDDLDLPFCADYHHDQDATTGSSGAMQIAKYWLNACKAGDDHALCQNIVCRPQDKDQAERSLPTRLLYIGRRGAAARIVAGQDLEFPYCALSYCRGIASFPDLRRANTSQMTDTVELDSLPTLFRDAITVAQQLGYQYIWIDALCIVQDDEQDRTQEAAMSLTTFANADVTISTLFAADCHQSLFTDRPMRATRPVPLDLGFQGDEFTPTGAQALFPRWPDDSDTFYGPAHSRGWTLQEQLVSRRILWFSRGTIHWECLEGYKAEKCFWEKFTATNSRLRAQLWDRHQTRLACNNILSGDTREAEKRSLYGQPTPSAKMLPFLLWKTRVVEESTRRQVSRPADRALAVTAVSRDLAQAAGNAITHGVWTGDWLLESLSWRVKTRGPVTQVSSTSAPSWSWESAEGEVSFDAVERHGRGEEPGIPGAVLISVDAADHKHSSSARLTMKSRLCRKRPLRKLLSGAAGVAAGAEWGPSEAVLARWCSENSGIFPDRGLESLNACYSIDLLAFPKGAPMRGYARPSGATVPGPKTVKLLLEPVDHGMKVFRRVGIAVEDGIAFQRGQTDVDAITRQFDHLGDDNSWPYTWLAIDERVYEDMEIVIV